MPMTIPPWLKPADPAAYAARGMQIGVEIGAQRARAQMQQEQLAQRAAEFQQEQAAQEAAQRFKMVQAERQAQSTARDQALAEQVHALKAQEAARKFQAVQEYQNAVAGGMDANEAMLKYGPAMAANTGAAAAIRAHQMAARTPKTWKEVTMPSGLSTVQSSTGDIRFPPRTRPEVGEAEPVEISGHKFLKVPSPSGGYHYQQIHDRVTGLSDTARMMARDRAERALDKLKEDPLFGGYLDEDSKPNPAWQKKGKEVTLAQWKSMKSRADTLRKRIDDLENPPGETEGTGTSKPAKSKVDRAHEISAEHPDWTKEQVIKAVNDEFK